MDIKSRRPADFLISYAALRKSWPAEKDKPSRERSSRDIAPCNTVWIFLYFLRRPAGYDLSARFAAARSRGSENNDPFVMEDGRVQTETNHAGGILGGITSGMPIVLRTAMKPTPSIAQPQRTVSLSAGENAELVIHGRHDPCIAHRAVPVVEAVTAAVLLDLLLEGHHGTF